MLPADLAMAEAQALAALQDALRSRDRGRWSIEWRFEGLRLLAPMLRLLASLNQQGVAALLLFSDAGAAALARRDAPDLAACIADFRQLAQRQPVDAVVLAVSPSAADYEAFEHLCERHQGSVVMVNGRLEDAAVGIGSVARERRRGFVATWSSAYALIPVSGGALRHAVPGFWELYRSDPDGYRAIASFEQRPDADTIVQTLSGDAGPGVASTLRAVDALFEGLRH